ncbi:MAG: hypothetical protein H6815_06440 [Phycisphaeraceae bacterium]|nr:hypothetical protein [Phycisphaerales bacterium]MCB9860078.1 hypothetical protein [Phycisphaeraceae bacterium]
MDQPSKSQHVMMMVGLGAIILIALFVVVLLVVVLVNPELLMIKMSDLNTID